jgi:hypothetical protein
VSVVIHQVDEDIERLRSQRNIFIATAQNSPVNI